MAVERYEAPAADRVRVADLADDDDEDERYLGKNQCPRCYGTLKRRRRAWGMVWVCQRCGWVG